MRVLRAMARAFLEMIIIAAVLAVGVGVTVAGGYLAVKAGASFEVAYYGAFIVSGIVVITIGNLMDDRE